ncbi:MAG: tetratricopeptide repeat protein [Candidatus Obscuribacterales bacterium]|nr:tetratricopeptide repeat protein [Candidatus Obscuribacterales bacterium]
MTDRIAPIEPRPVKATPAVSLWGLLALCGWFGLGGLFSFAFVTGDAVIRCILTLFLLVWVVVGPFCVSFFCVEASGLFLQSGFYKIARQTAALGAFVDKSVVALANLAGMADTPLAVLNLLNLSLANLSLCQFDLAVENCEGALDKSLSVFGWDHPLTQMVIGQLAVAFLYVARFSEADNYLNKSISSIQARLHDEDISPEESMSLMAGLAIDKFRLAELFERKFEFVKAEQSYRESIEAIITNTVFDTEILAAHLNRFGDLLIRLDRLEEAEPHTVRALEIREKIFSSSHPVLAESYLSFGHLLVKKGDVLEGEKRLLKAHAVFSKQASPNLGLTHCALAELASRKGDSKAAVYSLEQAMAVMDVALCQDHPDKVRVLEAFALALEQSGDSQRAAAIRQRAMRIRSCYQ